MNRLNVGDIISHLNWYGGRYRVEEIFESGDDYLLYSFSHNNILRWTYHPDLEGLIIEPANGKSTVEQKIAFMYQRFEKRNEQPTL